MRVCSNFFVEGVRQILYLRYFRDVEGLADRCCKYGRVILSCLGTFEVVDIDAKVIVDIRSTR